MTDKASNTTNTINSCEKPTTHTNAKEQEESYESSDGENCSVTTPTKKIHKWSNEEQHKSLKNSVVKY